MQDLTIHHAKEISNNLRDFAKMLSGVLNDQHPIFNQIDKTCEQLFRLNDDPEFLTQLSALTTAVREFSENPESVKLTIASLENIAAVWSRYIDHDISPAQAAHMLLFFSIFSAKGNGWHDAAVFQIKAAQLAFGLHAREFPF